MLAACSLHVCYCFKEVDTESDSTHVMREHALESAAVWFGSGRDLTAWVISRLSTCSIACSLSYHDMSLKKCKNLKLSSPSCDQTAFLSRGTSAHADVCSLWSVLSASSASGGSFPADSGHFTSLKVSERIIFLFLSFMK